MKPNTLEDLCKVMERLREENASVGRLAFTLPGIARVELTFPSNGQSEQRDVKPNIVARVTERNGLGFASLMLFLTATVTFVTGSGWAMLTFGIQSVLTTWAFHEAWLATRKRP
jgi:hypothetical protein